MNKFIYKVIPFSLLLLLTLPCSAWGQSVTAVDDVGTVSGKTAVIDLLANDLGRINRRSVSAFRPSGTQSKGWVRVNVVTGVMTYTPYSTGTTGTDTYNYTVTGTNGIKSNVATVSIKLGGAAPGTQTQAPSVSRFAVCSSARTGDSIGWGWENNATCVVAGSQAAISVGVAGTSTSTTNNNTATQTDSGVLVCRSAASDPDGDGWGYEDGQSCRVAVKSPIGRSSTSVATTPLVTPGVAPPPVAAANAGFQNGRPVCLTDSSEARNSGFGYENNRTCVITGATATRSRPLLNQRSCIPWLEIGYGNYKLQNNVWNSSAVFSDRWSQCIELTGGPGNYVAKWDYNWLNRNEGDEFAVKSYPQVYIGRKTKYNVSGSVAQTGMPVRIDRMGQFNVEYDYSETGIVERNVALESFVHDSCQAEDYNKQFEMMVWVGRPTIRTPGKLVSRVNLGGREWDVYTNPALSWSYVAFVAVQPHTSGSLNWNEFINWSRDVGPSVGVPYMNPNGCMGAIEIGTETFWGTGTFTLNRFKVNDL